MPCDGCRKALIRELDVSLDRINATHNKGEPLGQMQSMLPFATADVNGSCSRRQVQIAHEFIEHLGPARVQTQVKRGLEILLDVGVGVVELLERELIGHR